MFGNPAKVIPVMVRRMEAHSHNKANTFLYRLKHMTITGPCPGNDPLKSEGHPKKVLQETIIQVAAFAFSCFWGIHEVMQQEMCVLRGWFPENPE